MQNVTFVVASLPFLGYSYVAKFLSRTKESTAMLSRSIIFRGVVLPAALGVLLVGQAMASPSTALASGFIHHTVAVVIPTSPFPPLPPNPPGVARL